MRRISPSDEQPRLILPCAALSATTLLFVAFVPAIAFAGVDLTYTRKQARDEFDQSVDEVRRSMNSDPRTMEFALNYKLVAPLGSDPRVLALCREVIETSTNAASIHVALRALPEIVRQRTPLTFGRWHSTTFVHRRTVSEVHELLERQVIHADFDIRLAAAESLSEVGEWMRDAERDEALRVFRKLATESTSPEKSGRMWEVMARHFGDTSEVIGHFRDLLEKSSNADEARTALVHIKDIATMYYLGRGENRPNRSEIVETLRKALSNRHEEIQFESAAFLPKLGPAEAKEARAFMEKRLREPMSSGDAAPRAAAIQWLILPLLDSHRKEDLALIKAASSQNHLLDYYQQMLARDPSHRMSPYDQDRLQRWKQVLNAD